ncbi:uncharacterized protein LOC131064633 isoform X1 [Cryptomeria japonica]|uniref:uncharacterized protein LOC131064633 isoform X1 n=1 Tax=Cryptomeria japonica TaxID=3369 RepID=UPI0025ACA43F|nr:uncharacterized protein LOC131064633 isoform X1 [Cryptomeria japonica]
MEGSGSGSKSSYSSKSPPMGAPPASSISELFDGCASKSSGGHFGFGTESSKVGFTQQRAGVMGRVSNQTEGTAIRRHSEEHDVGSSARNMNGSNSQKGQSNHGKSRSLSDAFLTSSLCYGGRDLYNDPSTAKPEGLHGFKEDNMDDETNTPKASRGNWWQGSLYY